MESSKVELAKKLAKASQRIVTFIERFSTDCIVLQDKTIDVDHSEFAREIADEFDDISGVVAESESLIVHCTDWLIAEIEIEEDFQIIDCTWHNVAITLIDNLIHLSLVGEDISALQDFSVIGKVIAGVKREMMCVRSIYIADDPLPVYTKKRLMRELDMSRDTLNRYIQKSGLSGAQHGGGGKSWKATPGNVVNLCDTIIRESSLEAHKQTAIKLRGQVKATFES